MFLSFLFLACRAIAPTECENTVGMTDNATDTSTEPSADLPHVLEIQFTSMFSQLEPTVLEVGRRVTLGTWMFRSRNATALIFDGMMLTGYASNNPRDRLHNFEIGVDDGVASADYLEDCALTSYTETEIYSETVNPAENGTLAFVADEPIDTETMLVDGTPALAKQFHVYCSIKAVPVSEVGFSYDLFGSMWVNVHAEDGREITVDFLEANGGARPRAPVLLIPE